MSVTTAAGRECNQNVASAQKTAGHSPIFITGRGRAAPVLLSIAEYQCLTGQRRNIADALSAPATAGIDFEPPQISIEA